jgi:hypothetical protein
MVNRSATRRFPLSTPRIAPVYQPSAHSIDATGKRADATVESGVYTLKGCGDRERTFAATRWDGRSAGFGTIPIALGFGAKSPCGIAHQANALEGYWRPSELDHCPS